MTIVAATDMGTLCQPRPHSLAMSRSRGGRQQCGSRLVGRCPMTIPPYRIMLCINPRLSLFGQSLKVHSVKLDEERSVTDKAKPEWTGDSIVSKFVNAMISSPLIFGLMKAGARQQFKMTAEKNGIPWGKVVQSLESAQDELEALFQQVSDDSMTYPAYYTQPFHAYDEGNLNWLAAYEVEPATYSMAMRVWKDEVGLQPKTAQERLRGNAFQQVRQYLGGKSIESMLDVGCSSGVSTRYLANAFPEASTVVGLDLSPYFLSVALLRDDSQEHRAIFEDDVSTKNIKYVHGNAEHMVGTVFSEESFDMVSCQFILHELPPEPTRQIMEQCMKVLRPGGVLFLVDNDPKSAVIQNLPPAIFTLMKSTEPHSDEYYAWDQEQCLRQVGFVDVQTTPCDPRHRLIMARKKEANVSA